MGFVTNVEFHVKRPNAYVEFVESFSKLVIHNETGKLALPLNEKFYSIDELLKQPTFYEAVFAQKIQCRNTDLKRKIIAKAVSPGSTDKENELERCIRVIEDDDAILQERESLEKIENMIYEICFLDPQGWVGYMRNNNYFDGSPFLRC